jgi:hypothetical protein
VAHGGEKRRFCLIGSLGLQPCPFGLITRGFGCVLGRRKSLLPLLQLRDVAIDGEHAAIVQRDEVEFEVLAASYSPLEAAAGRIVDQRKAFPSGSLEIVHAPKSPRSAWKRRISQLDAPGKTTSEG